MIGPRIKGFFRAPTTRLALTYLAIIILMSIGFSIVFYKTSSHELGRQFPPKNLTDNSQHRPDNNPGMNPQPVDHSDIDDFLRQRISEGRKVLFWRLIILNSTALVAGSGISYLLARRSLRPIEQAMESQAQFVSDASHELRTPLTAIQVTNEVSLRDPKLNLKQAKGIIQSNITEVMKLKDLSDGLLDLAKQDSASLLVSKQHLPDVVTQALNEIIPAAAAKDITLEDKVPDIDVLGAEQAIVRILVMLLDNAVKYSHEGGTVWIVARTSGKSAFIEVKDEGAGIRASDLPHIFRRFYRADTVRSSKGAQSGYGLGLPIAHKLVERLGGTISVRSEVSHGSIFTIKLSLA